MPSASEVLSGHVASIIGADNERRAKIKFRTATSALMDGMFRNREIDETGPPTKEQAAWDAEARKDREASAALDKEDAAADEKRKRSMTLK